MEVPLDLAFRNMDPSEAAAERVREKTAKLGQYFDRIHSCRVVIEAPHRHHHKGKIYKVSIEIGVPGQRLVVNRSPDKKHAHEDVYVAIRDAFNDARRQLEHHARKTAGKVKFHEAPTHARVLSLNGLQGYGMASLPDGQEVYFHRNAVLKDAFDGLEVGDELRLVIAEGEGRKGPQASTVESVGKHRRDSGIEPE